MHTIANWVVIVMALAIVFADGSKNNWCENPLSNAVHVVNCVFFMTVASVVRRGAYWAEEHKHLSSRYNHSHWLLLRKLLSFNLPSVTLMVGACICLLLQFLLDFHIEFPQSRLHFGLICTAAYLLVEQVDLNKNPVFSSYFMDSLQHLDYGSGMAQNFFYGYLRLCLPDTGDSEKGIVERIEDYVSKQKLSPVCFPVKRLFILIPASTYLPNNLKDASNGWMQPAGMLEKQVKNRAGVIDRVYKNSVYRIQDPNDKTAEVYYVVAEGATPCKTLYEVVQYSGIRKEIYEENQKEIVLRFYETLKETLDEDRDCCGLCEFIYYVDVDENRDPVNVAHLILQRIRDIQLKAEETKRRQQRDWEELSAHPVQRTSR